MNRSLHMTTAFLGVYAGLLAALHGIFEILQGSRAPIGLMFNAIGPPCQPDAVWHACFPAMTLIPNLLVTGIGAIVIGLAMVVWAAAFVQRRHGELILGTLSILALLVGGGFVPTFIGLVAGITGSRQGMPVRHGGAGWQIISVVWPWPLVLMALWLPGSWLLGRFFGETLLAAGGLLFLVFDVGLPTLAAVSGFGHEKRPGGE